MDYEAEYGADALKELSHALALTDDAGLIEEFLRSILTDTEVKEISARWALVRMIDEGKSQRRIAQELGLSLCKITRGSRELKRERSPFKRMIELLKSSRIGNR